LERKRPFNGLLIKIFHTGEYGRILKMHIFTPEVRRRATKAALPMVVVAFIVGTIWMHTQAIKGDIFIEYGIEPWELSQQCTISASSDIKYLADPFTEASSETF
jgi:hypothetical protein